MDMSSSSSSSSASMSMPMAMTFTNTHNAPLYSTLWSPYSDGSYAGTCIFLIILAIVNRALFAGRAVLERRWLNEHANRRFIVVAGKASVAERIDSDPDAKFASLITAQGVQENVKVVQGEAQSVLPWRFGTDIPRALMFMFITGTGYLLMLAVMTMNVGYFCCVLAGTFMGELAVGRFIHLNEQHH